MVTGSGVPSVRGGCLGSLPVTPITYSFMGYELLNCRLLEPQVRLSSLNPKHLLNPKPIREPSFDGLGPGYKPMVTLST